MAYESKYASLTEVKYHLRYDADDTSNDTTLEMYLAGAEQAVDNYITTDLSGTPINAIKTAVLLLVGYYDDNRNPDKDTTTNGNYLPAPVQALLYPYRTPTVS